MNGRGNYGNWVVRLILLNVIIFFFHGIALKMGSGDALRLANAMTLYLGLTPVHIIEKLYLWEFFTYMFMHANLLHIGFNMYAVLIFGIPIEQTWGSRKFLLYYLFTGVGAGVTIFALNIVIGGSAAYSPTIGASGAVYGLLLAFGMLYPNVELLLFFVLPIKAKYLVVLFGGVELYMLSSTGGQGGISHVGHLGGILFGLVFFLVTRKHGIRFKAKIATARMEQKHAPEQKLAVSQQDNATFLSGILSKLKKSGPDSLDDDEIQHLKYIEIMSGHDDDMCVEEDFNGDDPYCQKCGASEACLMREIKKHLKN